MHAKRSSLRKSFDDVLRKKSQFSLGRGRLGGRFLFRAAGRMVMENIDWLRKEPEAKEGEIEVTVKVAEGKKEEEKALTIEDRSTLLVNPRNRTSEDKLRILDVMKKLNAFRRYTEKERELLAEVCLYQYLRPGCVIVRQGQRSENLYYIAAGEVSVTRIDINEITGEKSEIDMGVIQSGDMFGEIALLHELPRTATIITKTPVDLIYIQREEFDNILKDSLTMQWEYLQDALVNFNYFVSWNEEIMRECCILSKTKEFAPNEVLLGDGKGNINYVHFILEGECRLIEHILVKEEPTRCGMKYKLVDSKTARESISSRTKGRRSRDTEDEMQDELVDEVDLNDPNIDYTKIFLSRRPARKTVDMERMSIITATILDVMAEWHEITDVAEMLLREPSITFPYDDEIRTIFMQVCIFYRGACFGLGEDMYDRRIVSITPVRCFLVPRYWLFQHNHANIWQRVKLFLNSKFPNKEELFKRFLKNRQWVHHRKKLVQDIITKGRRFSNCASIHDVPYSIRITEDIISEV